MRRTDFLFDKAVEIFQELDGRHIVEVGAIRDPRGAHMDGHSTIHWPQSSVVWTVDTDPEALRMTRRLCGPHVICVLDDAIHFMAAFPASIDLLYLDGPHPDRENGRTWHRDAMDIAHMSERSVVLIDDCDLPRRGKGELAIPAAQARGFELVECGRQALLVRR